MYSADLRTLCWGIPRIKLQHCLQVRGRYLSQALATKRRQKRRKPCPADRNVFENWGHLLGKGYLGKMWNCEWQEVYKMMAENTFGKEDLSLLLEIVYCQITVFWGVVYFIAFVGFFCFILWTTCFSFPDTTWIFPFQSVAWKMSSCAILSAKEEEEKS